MYHHPLPPTAKLKNRVGSRVCFKFKPSPRPPHRFINFAWGEGGKASSKHRCYPFEYFEYLRSGLHCFLKKLPRSWKQKSLMCHLQYSKFKINFTKYSLRLSTHMFSQASLWEFSINVRGASQSAYHVSLVLALHMCLSRRLHTSGVRNQSEGCFPACLSSNHLADFFPNI